MEKTLAFADTYPMLNNRIGIFTSLPLRSLNEPSLKKQLDVIGRSEGAITPEKA